MASAGGQGFNVTDPWVYRSPSGEILTVHPVWDDDAGEDVYVVRGEDNRLVIVTGAAQEQSA